MDLDMNKPPVERLCTLPTFQGAFNASEFVSALCEDHMAQAKARPVFDARPFAETISQAAHELQGIRTKVLERTASLNSAVQVSQSVYTKKIRQLTNNFDATQSSFDSLQTRISEVGRTAIRIGEQLEALDRQRTRASETKDLIEFYYMFARGSSERLDYLRKHAGRDGRLKAATILRRLAVISREVDIEGSSATSHAIERYCEQFERDMLRLFDKYYRRSDPKMMSHIAHVLQRFNGGMSCINIYVNQHDFFISKQRMAEAEKIGTAPLWAHITDPNSVPPRSEPSLDALYADIRRTVELEAQIIAAVFPTPLLVMQLFLRRVFGQSVQAYIEAIMHRALEKDAAAAGTTRQDTTIDAAGLAFLRMLHVTRSATLLLVSELKTIDLRSAGITVSSGPYSSSNLDGLFALSNQEADALIGTDSYTSEQLAAAGGSVLGAMLDQSVEELFFQYLEQLRYLDRECRVLSGLFAHTLQYFFAWHQATLKATRTNATIFSRIRDQFTGNTGSFGSSVAFSTLSDSAGYGAAPQVSSFKRLVDRARGISMSEEEVAPPLPVGENPDERGEISLSLAERLLRWHAESLGRCVDLCAASDVPKNTFILLRVLTDAYLKAYVEAALETATVQMFGYDVRASTPPDNSVLTLLRRVEELTELWQHYVQTAVLPLTASSVTLRRETAIYNNHNMLRVEGKSEALLQKYTDNLLGFMASRLSTQKRTDYCPRNDDVALTQLNTEPCLAIVDTLEVLEQEARSTLSERTCEALFTEVGIGFHALLCDHLKKYTVNATGGLMLTKDLAMYQDVCGRFGVPVVNDRFEMLRQLGALFIVQPGVLKSYMREGHLSSVDETLLRPYLLRRQDYARDVRLLEEDNTGDTSTDEVQGRSSTLFASSNQSSTMSTSWSAAEKNREFSRNVSSFVTDVPDLASLSEQLVHPPQERPGSSRSSRGDSSPARSGTPQAMHWSVTGSPGRMDTGNERPSRTPSPSKMSRDPLASLHSLVQELDLS